MMNDCQDVEVRESLPELAHDALPEHDAARVREHLADCADCAAELAIIRAAIAAAEASSGMSRVVAHVDVARIAAAIPPYRRSRFRITALQRPMQIAAAALIGAIGISVAVARHDGGPTTTTTVAPAMLSASAASGVALIGTADVSDAHLAQLIADLDHLDAVPPAEPEPVTPVALENSGGGA